jgi:hypothetical protein
MAITQFEQNTIKQAAQSHSEMVEALKGRLRTLSGVVDSTLGTAPSEATRALQTTYDLWISNVEKMIIDRVNSLSETMTRTADEQTEMDQQNRRDISQVGIFLNG